MKQLTDIILVLFIAILLTPLYSYGGDKERFCNNYADESIAQFKKGKQAKLPGIVFPAWSNDRNAHYIWCTFAAENTVNNERAKRQAYLDKHLPKKITDGRITQGIFVGEALELSDFGKLMGAMQTDHSYLGCYKDQKNRDLSGFSFNAADMTKARCLSQCQQKGFKYAGLQYGSFCFCGNSYGKIGQGNNCNTPCAGNKQEICGGRWANSVYQVMENKPQHRTNTMENSNNTPLARHLTPIQDFNQLKKISPRPDPIVATFMHTLEKASTNATDFSKIEQIMLKGIQVLSPAQRTRLKNKWRQIPMSVRLATIPPSLRNINPMAKINMSDFKNSLIEAANTTSLKQTEPSTGQLTEVDLQNAQFVVNAPEITGFSPMGPDGLHLEIGRSFTLRGSNYGIDKTKARIHFLQYRNGRYVLVASIFPQSITDTIIKSQAIAPDLGTSYEATSNKATRIIVEVDNKFSSPLKVVLAASRNPTPVIAKVEPSSAYPGSKVLVTGKNIKPPLDIFIQALDQRVSQNRKSGFFFNTVSDSVLNPRQFEFTVPQSAWSGHYKFNLRSGNSGYSDSSLLNVLPTRYKVKFTKFRCLDESNEWSSSDELVVAWVIIVDDTGWTKGSAEYGSVDKGEVKDFTPADASVIPAPGKNWAAVNDFLYFNTTLYEVDKGDMKSYTNAIKAVGEIAPGVGAAIGAAFGNPEAGKKIGEFVKIAGDGLAKLISWIGNDNDLLGSDSRFFLAPEIQQLTAKQPIISDAHSFINNDKTGSHILYFNIIRNYAEER